MSLTAHAVPPCAALGALRDAVTTAKGGNPLAGVIVVVPTNRCGVMTRRALGREAGIAGIDTVTLPRLAELIAGPSIAADGRRPLSSPVLDLALTAALRDVGGRRAAVAGHPSTLRALRQVTEESRSLDPEGVAALAAHEPELSGVLQRARAALSTDWYDAADVVARARDLAIGDAPLPTGGRPIVLHLPERVTPLDISFVRALAVRHSVSVVVAITGDVEADRGIRRMLDALGAVPQDSDTDGLPTPARVVSTTDADDEVHHAMRVVIDAARGVLTGRAIPFERIAVLWPAHRPYARLVEHRLRAAGLPFNGRSGTEVAERIAPRFLLDLLDLDRRGVSRAALFDLLADIPPRDGDGHRVRVAPWERASRAAGVGTGDWEVRLDALPDRWQDAAHELRTFVDDLVTTLGERGKRQTWRHWADWCDARLDEWFPAVVVRTWPDLEYRAWEQTIEVVERLRHLDEVGNPVDRGEFRRVLEGSLAELAEREGRVGAGVTVGALAGAAGLDVDVAVVLGCADGVLPPPPRRDPLLDDATRVACGLPTAPDHAGLLRHHLLVTMSTASTVLTVPRCDLRATATLHPSRWIEGWLEPTSDTRPPVRVDRVASHAAGVASVEFAPDPSEHRLAQRWRHVRQGGAVGTAPAAAGDPVLAAALALRTSRAADALTAYDGNLSGRAIPPLGRRPLAATHLEACVACPYGYFVERLLGVRPIEEPGGLVEIDRAERGSLIHRVLDLFHRDVIEGRLPQPTTTGWTDAHAHRLRALFDAQASELERRGRVGRPATWIGERERIRRELDRWLEVDGQRARASGTTVLASEHRFGTADPERPDAELRVTYRLPGGRPLPVHGSIDRVDQAADGLVVVTDHKTGKDDTFKNLSEEDPTLGGTHFQLPLYAAAARALVGDDSAIVRAEYSMFAVGKFRRHGVTFTPEVDALVADQVAHVVAGIESGWFPARPERPGFQPFVRCWYCNPDGLGTDGVWAEWERKRHDPAVAEWFGDPS